MKYINARSPALLMSRATKIKKAKQEHALRDILVGVWGLNPGEGLDCPAAYNAYYREWRLLNSSQLGPSTKGDIIKLVTLVKRLHNQPLGIIKDEIKRSRPNRVLDGDEAVRKIVDAIIQLWLMIRPQNPLSTKENGMTLQEIVAQSIQPQKVPTAAKSIEELSPDFTASNLYNKAGIRIIFTSCICDHLLMSGKHQLKVFHYAALLRKYREDKSVEKTLYPEHLLLETERTLAVLFPTADYSWQGSARTRKLRDKHDVDIEAQLGAGIHRDLSAYSVWKERLMIVQYAYNVSEPCGPKQLWCDRRHKVTWATFWVALVVFLLTLIFGLISSVTGILQVVIARKALQGTPL